jgi:mono/diheme cytochrome c family protein
VVVPNKGKLFVVAALLAFAARGAGAADDLTAGRKLYTAKCASCHKLYEPARYNDEKWEYWMKKMKRKARLNDEQYKRLSEYLQSVRSEAVQTTSVNAK